MPRYPSGPLAPIVYLGPSLPWREARLAFPGSDLRGPIRRGELYRDRILRHAVFLIIDGVFLHEQAVSPREIIDVLEDGAFVVGASSMGALRAAECWPVGMRGVGTIYRLFRSGCLQSDDEVAITCDPSDHYRPLSVPLINVRYALSRAVRAGWLGREAAEHVVRVAVELFYAQRSWRVILDRAGLADQAGRLVTYLAQYDLKKMDALRALRAVSRWLAAEPQLADRPRRSQAPFMLSEETRELGHDALAGARAQEIKEPLARWCLVSGRYTRHFLAIIASHPHLELNLHSAPEDAPTALQIEAFFARIGVFSEREKTHWLARWSVQRATLAAPAALSVRLSELWGALAATLEAFSESLWAALVFSGDLDAEIFRWRAIHEAAAQARQLGLEASPHDRYLAETEIAQAHGYSTWSELFRVAETTGRPWAWFVAYRDTLALAKRMRQRLFRTTSDGA
jgi:hypothetical protein